MSQTNPFSASLLFDTLSNHLAIIEFDTEAKVVWVNRAFA